MWGMLSRNLRLSRIGFDQFSQSVSTFKHQVGLHSNILRINCFPFKRDYRIKFTPRSLLVGRFISPTSSRLPCLTRVENVNAQVNQPLVIDLGITNKQVDVPERFPSKPITAPTITIIYDYQNQKENETPEGLKELLAPEYGKFKKYAARLIVIRRRKMKKHKLKKLRKRMKFEWAKIRQRRELRKEKAFQASLLEEIRLAEKFNAEEWAIDVLRRAKETPISKPPRKTKEEIMIGKYGRVLPH
ncbi:uncharacterized protein LOC124157692 [Ischnura elegans]|uniref:uncharacterized protein LOC124157692 n=1 Tax=Ischnura elegans TaxID=197161 RepID=UPI001ED88B73|nr:uncharacterized protein LOC124157692 [Ischnura elegans]